MADGARLSPRTGMLLAAPAMLLLIAAILWPTALFLARSFSVDPPLAEFAKIASEGVYLTVLWRTLVIAVAVTALSVVLAYPLALMLDRLQGWRQAVLVIVVLLPLWTSVLVRSFAWTVILSRRGILNEALQGAGLTNRPLTLIYTSCAVVVAMTHVLLPFLILPLWNGLRQIPADYRAAAHVMGASDWTVFRRITLPLSAPGAAVGALFVFMISLGFFITPALVGGPRSMMIGTLISKQALESLDWPFAAALSLVITGAVLAVMPLLRRFFFNDAEAAQ